MSYLWIFLLTAALQVPSAPATPAQPIGASQYLTPASLDRIARDWVSSAAAGDLIPAVSATAPITSVPSSYLTDVSIIQDTTRRCRWRPGTGRRTLLLCADDFSLQPRQDTPRAQLIVQPVRAVAPSDHAPTARLR